MKIGVLCTGDLHKRVALAMGAEEAGLEAAWFPGGATDDALVQAAFAASYTKKIQLGTAVMQVAGRSPHWVVGAARTFSDMCERPLDLALGSSTPALRESLGAASPWTAELEKFLSQVAAELERSGLDEVSPMLAIQGHATLAIARRTVRQVMTWLARPGVISQWMQTTDRTKESGGELRRWIIGLPVACAARRGTAISMIDASFGHHANRPSFRSTLHQQDAESVSAVALVGDEPEVAEQFALLRQEADGIQLATGIEVEFMAGLCGTDLRSRMRALDALAPLRNIHQQGQRS